jgi:glycosyltransferase involved in cell wall biosynthesis
MTGLIAHEWIEPIGGSENVLEAIAALYPDAELITPWNNAPHRFPERTVHELWLSRSPFRGRKALSAPVLTTAWRSAVPRDKRYDWILASSHMFAHHIRPRALSSDAPKLVYAYTPARYVWTPELDARGQSLAAKLGASVLRPIDKRRAAEPVAVAAISNYIRDRIRNTWDRDAEVIYPPVDVEHIFSVPDWREQLAPSELRTLDSLPRAFVLGASRFIPYKALDLVIRAAARAGMPAVIAGQGPEQAYLHVVADEVSTQVIFVDAPSTPMLYALYSAADVFVFPPVEDFGIMPIEAIALGTPVVAAAEGGSLETVTDGTTGAHFESADVVKVAAAIERAMALNTFDPRSETTRFSRATFDRDFGSWVTRTTAGTN